MKKLRVKVRKRESVVINYDIKKIITDKGIYSFDDIKFEYICKCDHQQGNHPQIYLELH